MGKVYNGVVLGQLQSLLEGGGIGSLSDEELIRRFLDDRQGSGGAAFGAIVHRHGPLVFGVCRRILRDTHQVEDAFQATFLVLAMKARSIRDREALGPWLAGVAGKVSARARGDAHRRRCFEAKLVGWTPDPSPSKSPDSGEVAALMEELAELRQPLREAVVLCHLQGLSYDSAAETLGVSETTVRGRLARAKVRLRVRLAHRGLSQGFSVSVLAALRIQEAAPARLLDPIVRASVALANGRPLVGIVPGSTITLMEGTVKVMLNMKLRVLLGLVLGIGLVTAGSAVSVQARQKPDRRASDATSKGAEARVAGPELATLVGGRIVRSAEVSKDCMILSYLPDWSHGNVDNLGISNADSGVRTLVDWPDIPSSEAKSADLRFYLAFYSRKTTAKAKPGSIVGFELTGEWLEQTSWKVRPSYDPEPVITAKFEPGEGWKLFDVTSLVRERDGHSGDGLMFRFQVEDRSAMESSGYELVSREGKDQWALRRPMLVVVEPTKKVSQANLYLDVFIKAFW